ncbi:MAG: hypothetical protein ISP49_14785 [Reyranella sp.]|nr:hypothetical protein [Reyranella sp.]
MGVFKSREGAALSADEIARHPRLHAAVREQSQQLLQAYDGNPHLAAVFGTQHRWLMGQAALALAFRAAAAGTPGVSGARILDFITEHGVASRNTANAFLQEMVYYGWARIVPGAADRRIRPIEPTEASVVAIHGWVGIHLATLDRLDDGRRLQTYLGTPDSLVTLQPLIADGLLSSSPVREPEPTFSLFTWLNQGGPLMDWLISGIEEADPDVERVPTAIASIAVMAERLMLSRTHLSRKLKAAEALGSIGWQGKRGQSLMWVSSGFRREYAMAQAIKLAIVDSAFASCFPQRLAEVPAMQGVPIDGPLHEAA